MGFSAPVLSFSYSNFAVKGLDMDGKFRYNHTCVKLSVEKYRSGRNEPHSKCGCPKGHVGSNPTFSAI